MAGYEPILMLAGLGNPEPRYTNTLHNAGFWFVDELASKFRGEFRLENKFKSELCRVEITSQQLWLLKPVTYVNESGAALSLLANYYKLTPTQILVAHDDIDLMLGAVRLKFAGGHGGHNGLRDIFTHLGSQFWRLRIGIGHPGHKDDVVDYVLSDIDTSSKSLISTAITDAVAVMENIASGDMDRAMQALHSRNVTNEDED